MYNIKIDQELLESIKSRGREPIYEFDEQGYIKDWAFKVDKAFSTALCIQNGVNGKLQGAVIVFERGDTFHSNILGCQDDQWLKYLSLPDTTTLEVTHCNSTGFIKEKFDYGYIRFDIYKTDSKKLRLEKVSTIECNVIEFLSILKNGLRQDV